MARDLTTGMEAQTTAGVVCPILLVSITFASSIERMWTGIGDLLWTPPGYVPPGPPVTGPTLTPTLVWKGMGDLGKISNITESGGVQAEGMAISLSQIANDILADSLTEIRVGRPALVYLGFLNSDGTVVADPYCMYRGMVDVPTTNAGTTASEISIKIENRLNDMGRNSSLRIDSETQRRKYPGDAGCDFIPQLVDSAWAWK